MLSIVLYEPEIPGNTGSIGRSVLAINARLILIKPYGFEITQKTLRRAGLDYWQHLSLTEYDNWQQFLQTESPRPDELFLLSTKATKNYFEQNLPTQCYLVFGPETRGLPQELIQQYKENLFRIPMFNPHVRSLNLSNCANVAMYEYVRQR